MMQGEQPRWLAPHRMPGNRSRLELWRSRGEYGCGWMTHVRRTGCAGRAVDRRGSQRPNSPRGIGARAFRLRTAAACSASRPPASPLALRSGRANGVASPRPLSTVIRGSSKSASEVSRSAGGDEYAISVAANPAAEQSAHRRSANPQPPAASSGTHWRS